MSVLELEGGMAALVLPKGLTPEQVTMVDMFAKSLTEGVPPSPLSLNDARALLLLVAERGRQITGEGYDPAHDDEHRGGELALAGACYALASTGRATADYVRGAIWPFEPEMFKPRLGLRDLVRAGGLIAAEIARRLRAGETLP